MLANSIVISRVTWLLPWDQLSNTSYYFASSAVDGAARIVCGFGAFRMSKLQLLSKCGWLSVKQLVYYHTLLKYDFLATSYPYHTQNSEQGLIRVHGKTLPQTGFTYRAIKCFNSVPIEVGSGLLSAIKGKLDCCKCPSWLEKMKRKLFLPHSILSFPSKSTSRHKSSVISL